MEPIKRAYKFGAREYFGRLIYGDRKCTNAEAALAGFLFFLFCGFFVVEQLQLKKKKKFCGDFELIIFVFHFLCL